MAPTLTNEERRALESIHKTPTDAAYRHQAPVSRLFELGLVEDVAGFLALTKLGKDVLRSPPQSAG